MQFIKCQEENGLPVIIPVSIVESIGISTHFEKYIVRVTTNIEWAGSMMRFTVSAHNSKEDAIAEIDRIYELLNSAK